MEPLPRQTILHREPSSSTRSPRGTSGPPLTKSNSSTLPSPLSPGAPHPPQRTSSNATKRPSYYSHYSEKPLPDPLLDQLQRPGTAGTEAALKINIHRASEQLRQAQQAERMYRAMKRAAAVHANRSESKEHFRQGVEHLQLGVRKGFLGMVGFPHIIRESLEMRRQKRLESKDEKRARKGGKGVMAPAPGNAGLFLEGETGRLSRLE